MSDIQHTKTYKTIQFLSKQPLRLARFFAKCLGFLAIYQKNMKVLKAARLNIQIALPHLSIQEHEHILKSAVKNELTSYFEFLNVWGASNEKNISRIHHVQGKQYFFDALEAKKGIVLVVPHFGTWETMNAWFAQYTAMTIMYKPVKNQAADLFVRHARSRENATLVPTDESGVRQVFRALKQGGTTVILPDHSPDVGGDLVDYFGVPLASSQLSAKLIQKTKAHALFLYAKRNDQDGYDMVIEPVNPKIYEASNTEGTRIIHQMIEELIQKYPEHYHWSYKRFMANPQLHGLYDIPEQEALQQIKQLRQD